MNKQILVVEDEAEIRSVLGDVLKGNYHVTEAASGAELKKMLSDEAPDAILLDLNLGDSNGLELLPLIRKSWPETEVIVLTGNTTVEAALEATRRGAFHFLSKPFEFANLQVTVERALEHKSLREETKSLREALTSGGGISPIFHSPSMRAVLRTIERIAPSDVTVLITGESGTGKEVIADLIHTLSPRSKNKIIKINCAALPRELIESELFGYVKGAFTGAHADRNGLFRTAEDGTLFLDEISEMPVETQSKLLRILQDQKVRPVGGKTDYQTNCRIIAATNRNPEDAIRSGKLRDDLYYRISAISIHLPPLRERRDDIMPLANSFLKRFDAQANRSINEFSLDAKERLTSYDWPGNIRQLQNEIQRAVLLCEDNEIRASDFSVTNIRTSVSISGEMDSNFTLLESVERNAIIQMLKETEGNKHEAARRLGIGRQTLYNKIKAYGIET
ncbi:MAG TPA: sigma-54 dependent transcriptional regulator [Verrucomicrobiae bacterium]